MPSIKAAAVAARASFDRGRWAVPPPPRSVSRYLLRVLKRMLPFLLFNIIKLRILIV